MKVVQFTGTLPAPPPVVIPFRIHAAGSKEQICDVCRPARLSRTRPALCSQTQDRRRPQGAGRRARQNDFKFQALGRRAEGPHQEKSAGRASLQQGLGQAAAADIAAVLGT